MPERAAGCLGHLRKSQNESARTRRALSSDFRPGSAVGAVPCDTRDVRAGDADVGQFAGTELVERIEAGVVAPPSLEEVDDCEQHVECLSPDPRVGSCVESVNMVSCCAATDIMLRCSYAENAYRKSLIIHKIRAILGGSRAVGQFCQAQRDTPREADQPVAGDP